MHVHAGVAAGRGRVAAAMIHHRIEFAAKIAVWVRPRRRGMRGQATAHSFRKVMPVKAIASLSTAIAAAALVAAIAPVSHAQSAEPAGAATLAVAAEVTTAEVQRVDTATGRVTLRHGAIRSLNLAAATMAFAVSDPALLEGLQPGETVKFVAIKTDDGVVVTEIRRSK